MSRRRTLRLRTLARQYLTYRRACGYRMHTEEYVLRDFTRYAERTARGRPITTALALQWIAQRRGLRAVTRANRLDTLRAFARFCHPFVSANYTAVLPGRQEWRSDRNGLLAKCCFHSRGVSSATRAAGCLPTRWRTSTR